MGRWVKDPPFVVFGGGGGARAGGRHQAQGAGDRRDRSAQAGVAPRVQAAMHGGLVQPPAAATVSGRPGARGSLIWVPSSRSSQRALTPAAPLPPPPTPAAAPQAAVCSHQRQLPGMGLRAEGRAGRHAGAHRQVGNAAAGSCVGRAEPRRAQRSDCAEDHLHRWAMTNGDARAAGTSWALARSCSRTRASMPSILGSSRQRRPPSSRRRWRRAAARRMSRWRRWQARTPRSWR